MGEKMVPVTQKVRNQLAALEKASGVGLNLLFKGLKNRPPGLTIGLIKKAMEGSLEEIDTEHLAFTIGRWERLIENGGKSTKHARPLSEEERQELRRHRERTGVEAKTLLTSFGPAPEGLTNNKICGILNGRSKTVREDHFRFLKKTWEGLPDKPTGSNAGQLRDAIDRNDRVKITPDIHERLKTYNRLQWLPSHIFKNCDGIPDGLNAGMVSSWLTGKTKTASQTHLEFVFNRCETLASGISKNFRD